MPRYASKVSHYANVFAYNLREVARVTVTCACVARKLITCNYTAEHIHRAYNTVVIFAVERNLALGK